MILNTETALSELVKQGFKGKAIELLSEYPHITVLERERAMIEERLKVIAGPLYNGEAEALLFHPLLEALRSATSKANVGQAMVARTAYQLAASYALIHDISKISQSKEIAKEITVGTLQKQPVVAAFNKRLLARKSDDIASPNNEGASKTASAIWYGVSEILRDGLVVSRPSEADTRSGERHTTPLSLLYDATMPGLSIPKITNDMVNVWDVLLANLRHGKGTPLDRDGRKVYMSELTEVLMRIDMLIKDAISESGTEFSGSDDNTSSRPRGKVGTAFVDAYTAMYWLLMYLDVVAEYDVIMPASDLMLQSQAWVLIIKTQSSKLKKTFVDIAQIAAAFDIFTAIKLWNEVYAFYDPILNHSVSAVADMNALWSEVQEKASKTLSSFAKDQVDGIFSSFKTYMEADYLLPEKDFAVAGSVLADYQNPQEQSLEIDGSQKTYFLARGGLSVFTATDSVGEAPLNITDRYMLVPKLASSAGIIEEALMFIKRAREILQVVEETDDIYHALLPSGLKWDNPFSLMGTIRDMKEATFVRTDPMQLVYEKYDVVKESSKNGTAVGSLDWKFTPLLMHPFYKIPQLQAFTKQRSKASRILWPGIGTLPIGDVISSQYIAQPLPACYTASRNANFVSNDMKAYMTLMSGRSGVTTSSRDLFRKLASILQSFRNTYARGILDALSATMFVYELKDSTWTWLRPSCPTVYGLPLEAMHDINAWDGPKKNTEATASRYERVVLDGGATYAFVLHSTMPEPDAFVYFAYPYTKGAYLQVPLLRWVFEKNREDLGKQMGISFDSATSGEHDSHDLDNLVNLIRGMSLKSLGQVPSTPVMGWAPYLVNLPHFLCSYQDEPAFLMDEEYLKYALVSVRIRYDEVERAIYAGGFIDNPVEILDMADYRKSADDPDPSPIIGGNKTSVPDAEPETKEVTTAEKEKAAVPSTLSASPKDEKGNDIKDELLANVATVSNAPIVDKRAVKVPADQGGAEKTTVDKGRTADVMAGDVDPEQAGSPEVSTSQGERYWKKLTPEGQVADVIKAVSCPNGYVPASEEEYKDYVLKAQRSEAIKEE